MEPDYTEITTEDEFGTTHWRFDQSFLNSNWTCIWGRGCLGILDHPAPELSQGCCSVGAEFGDDDEAMTTAALAATLAAARVPVPRRGGRRAGVRRRPADQHAGRSTARASSSTDLVSRVARVAPCTSARRAIDEPPIEWKPSVCWQLPLHVEWESGPDGAETATMRGWSRADWGAEGATMAWCCTEGERAYVGEQRVIDSLADELAAMMPAVVYVELRRRLG